ncbi:TIGR04219 family outer membrane beta-barrel protein [Shewanella gelidimarina]|uniref:TIGR04219 family outer membrane beta-barrel protein n=1 Tax=Shewanella gelidimarina TaxID=56813 RepID=UPI00200C945E|nr:TIGR04219 family outer membrane beta-barrel protein [Shewanella gelidimarina]MCL1057314.1 TIGR04219 family outer membrane beta-barrel protein [Shewanella gelidimarina]
MKKTLLACALLGSLVGTSAHAASVIGFKVGGDYWQADTSGTFAQRGQPQQEFNYKDDSQGSVWLAIEHPIPLVPNVKIRENRLNDKGSMSDADFSFNDHNFIGDVNATTDLSNTDFVLYYEILDNDIVALDIGAAYKVMHGEFRVSDAGHPETKDIDSGIVMGYVDAQVGIPGLGLYGFADIMMGVDESSVYDYSVGLGWNFDGTALDYRIRAGYRDFKFDVNGFDGVTADMQFKGYFAGVELVF